MTATGAISPRRMDTWREALEVMDRQDRGRDGAVPDAPAVQGLRQLLRRIDRVGAERLVPGDEDHRLRDEPHGLGRARLGPGSRLLRLGIARSMVSWRSAGARATSTL